MRSVTVWAPRGKSFVPRKYWAKIRSKRVAGSLPGSKRTSFSSRVQPWRQGGSPRARKPRTSILEVRGSNILDLTSSTALRNYHPPLSSPRARPRPSHSQDPSPSEVGAVGAARHRRRHRAVHAPSRLHRPFLHGRPSSSTGGVPRSSGQAPPSAGSPGGRTTGAQGAEAVGPLQLLPGGAR